MIPVGTIFLEKNQKKNKFIWRQKQNVDTKNRSNILNGFNNMIIMFEVTL